MTSSNNVVERPIIEIIKNELRFKYGQNQLTIPKSEIDLMVQNKKKDPNYSNKKINWQMIQRQLEFEFFTYDIIESPTIHEDYVPWLGKQKKKINWHHTNLYNHYLKTVKYWPINIIKNIDKETDKILDFLENPKKQAPFNRRGLVVGDVQSGKTANYMSLICKAIDSGYKFIIILTGMHNTLRSQTQMRIDEEILGYDSSKFKETIDTRNEIRIGVGKIKYIDQDEIKFRPLTVVTNSSEKGDFNTTIAKTLPGIFDTPTLAIIKKNVNILKNIRKYAINVRGEIRDGKRIVDNIPMLIIDDEADSASINTNLNLDDPSTINKHIRLLLDSFTQSSYVAYTATPFANIYIDDQYSDNIYGNTLFPRDFLVNLESPEYYVGPELIFGLKSYQNETPMPIFEFITEQEKFIPRRHSKDHIVRFNSISEPSIPPNENLPPSLKNAIYSFIIAGIIRYARGQVKDHNSMLIHISRFVNIQNQLNIIITKFVNSLKNVFKVNDPVILEQTKEKFKKIFEEEFYSKFSLIKDHISFDNSLDSKSWEEILPFLKEIINKLNVKEINGTSKDLTNFKDPNGTFTIFIGGDKLSRGLTLEGLTTSYFLRASIMYDTLMQMGRWFGYRFGYVDVCRLYLSTELFDWYRHITIANIELKNEFIQMSKENKTPKEFGLKVRSHPNLLITARNKMRTGTKLRLNLEGSTIESYILHNNKKIIEQNYNHTKEFIQQLTNQDIPNNHQSSFVFKNISNDLLIDFISKFQVHQDCYKFNPNIIITHIRNSINNKKIQNWDIGLFSLKNLSENSKLIDEFGGLKIITPSRSTFVNQETLIFPNNRIIGGMEDEYIGLSKDEINQIKQSSFSNKIRLAKQFRSKKNKGLLMIYPFTIKNKITTEVISYTNPIIGIAISFPEDPQSSEIEYIVNNIYLN